MPEGSGHHHLGETILRDLAMSIALSAIIVAIVVQLAAALAVADAITEAKAATAQPIPVRVRD